ncbi:hypothetical protein JN09_000103 [Acholeplasma morum]|jgi:hypothetical protein|uniref:SHOCT-like domain-containing protein n=1 Tax=Paracholeplasma morum TaxID=264637 RepID=UPI00195C3B96|nr:hypothetical protein [Paracholeplasma morum]MBM7452797.1 hypothetical protein [Paracholeplasma morum]
MSDSQKILEMLKEGIITVDEADRLLKALEKEPSDQSKVEVIVPKYKSDPKNLMFKVRIISGDGDKVNVNIPLKFAKTALKSGKINFGNSDIQNNIDMDSIIEMIEDGHIGEIVDITSADGDIVKIFIE